MYSAISLLINISLKRKIYFFTLTFSYFQVILFCAQPMEPQKEIKKFNGTAPYIKIMEILIIMKNESSRDDKYDKYEVYNKKGCMGNTMEEISEGDYWTLLRVK